MAIILIHGYVKEKQRLKPEYGNMTLTETVLIEADATDNVLDITAALPASPASITATNPKGISFTLQVSPHADSSFFILREAGELEVIGGGWWSIELTYKINELSTAVAGSSSNPKNRKDQVVANPLSRPVVWNSSSQQVQKETYTKPDGTVIRHTNGLPLDEPYVYEETHHTHTFSFNVNSSSFNWSDFEVYLGKVSSAIVFGKTAQKVKLQTGSFSEEYESTDTGIGKTEYHYMRVTLQFEINPSGWTDDAKVVSRSTLQLVPTLGLYPIDINGRGDRATSPWPLDAAGLAIPYDDNDPTDYATVSTGYPETANLATLASAYSLVIP